MLSVSTVLPSDVLIFFINRKNDKVNTSPEDRKLHTSLPNIISHPLTFASCLGCGLSEQEHTNLYKAHKRIMNNYCKSIRNNYTAYNRSTSFPRLF